MSCFDGRVDVVTARLGVGSLWHIFVVYLCWVDDSQETQVVVGTSIRRALQRITQQNLPLLALPGSHQLKSISDGDSSSWRPSSRATADAVGGAGPLTPMHLCQLNRWI